MCALCVFLAGKQGRARHRRRHLIELRVQSYSRALQGHAISYDDGVTAALDAELDERVNACEETSRHSSTLVYRIGSSLPLLLLL